MATGVDIAIAEVELELTVQAPESEGLDDLERLNIGAAALDEVMISRAQYAKRMALEEAFVTAGKALLADGYPDLPARSVPAQILAKLEDQAATIEAALKKFTPKSLTTLGGTFNAPEPKG